jgi:GT2 family glycosyltransferase
MEKHIMHQNTVSEKRIIGSENATFGRDVLPKQVYACDNPDIPDISICLVNWNTRDMLRDCLASIYEQKEHLHIEIFVIDNASDDESARMVKKEFPEVVLIANTDNKGFARANNQGIQRATGRHVFLLNPDTVILPDALTEMVRFLDSNPRAGAVAARLFNTDGTLQYSLRHFPNFLTPFTENTNLAHIPGIHCHSKKSRLMTWSHETVREVEQPAGAALMIKRSCIETLGSLNSCYHMFFEDVDICYRIRENGWKIYYLPDARVVHHGGQSVKKRKDMGLQFYRSLIKFFRIHRGRSWEYYVRVFMVALSLYCMLYSLLLVFRNPKRGLIVGKSAFNVMRSAFYRIPTDMTGIDSNLTTCESIPDVPAKADTS